ncbi:14540_t:CDS:2 [Acaulospora colombiana]|uniref:14540_t:CDS:1 n=1 Tax=Acaulospora colombiana TaxID=27376 RepID=A0ACA9KEY8_9GLOM|nr:14540_t:CDS:2 [Acaulospora colombiana]
MAINRTRSFNSTHKSAVDKFRATTSKGKKSHSVSYAPAHFSAKELAWH